MKYIFTLAIVLLSASAFAQKLDELTVSEDNTFGYTPENPIKMRRGNPGKSTNFAISFLTSLETKDGQGMILRRTSIILDPKYEHPVRQIDLGRQTAFLSQRASPAFGTPMGDNLVDKGLLQEYVFITKDSQETVRLYVDIYHKEDLQIPSGLRLKEQGQEAVGNKQ